MSASLYPSLPSLVLVLICSALCFIHRALRPAVIECVLSPYPRNYSLLVESNSAHAAFSTNRCRSISYRAILTWREEHISSWRVFNKHRTRHSAPFWGFFCFFFYLSAGTQSALRAVDVCGNMNVYPKKIAYLDWTCLSLCCCSQLVCDGSDKAAWVKQKCTQEQKLWV